MADFIAGNISKGGQNLPEEKGDRPQRPKGSGEVLSTSIDMDKKYIIDMRYDVIQRCIDILCQNYENKFNYPLDIGRLSIALYDFGFRPSGENLKKYLYIKGSISYPKDKITGQRLKITAYEHSFVECEWVNEN